MTVIPVSYTHLDVYKRQKYENFKILWRYDLKNGENMFKKIQFPYVSNIQNAF